MFKPSPYQQAVYDWVEDHLDPRGRLIVNAVAGSGKTTTIVGAVERIPADQKVLVLAFNKSIAMAMAERLPSHVESSTLNSAGHRMLVPWIRNQTGGKNPTLDANKTRKLVRQLYNGGRGVPVSAVANLVAKAKAHALAPKFESFGYEATRERWFTLLEKFDISDEKVSDDELIEMAQAVLAASAEQIDVIDFDDQLWMPVINGLRGYYDWIVTDESQDISHVQRKLIANLMAHGAGYLGVGDRRQSIYGFRGADSNSMDNLKKFFKAEELPLSVSYRCPAEVVRYAQSYCEEIQPREDAPAGLVRDLPKFNPKYFRNEDLVLCRNNAPLVRAAYQLLGKRVPVRMQGRDFGKNLVSLIDGITDSERGTSVVAFDEMLQAWADREVEKILNRDQDDDAGVQVIEDKVESLRAVMDSTPCEQVGCLVLAIEDLFASKSGVTLSSIHRAKGLEAERVFLLEPQLVPSPKATQEWQVQQERNLAYVAYTRALSELYFMRLEAFTDEDVAA